MGVYYALCEHVGELVNGDEYMNEWIKERRYE